MHQYNTHMGYMANKEEFLEKQIEEDLSYFDELEKKIEKEKKEEAQYINDRILRMKSRIKHMQDDLEAKEKEFLNIQKNKEYSIYIERDDYVKQQQNDKYRITQLQHQIKVAKRERDNYALTKLRLILKKEKENLTLSVQNNIRVIKLRLKDLNSMIESHKACLATMYQEIVDFQNKELIGINEDKVRHKKKFEEKFRLAEETKNAIIEEAEMQLKSLTEVYNISDEVQSF